MKLTHKSRDHHEARTARHQAIKGLAKGTSTLRVVKQPEGFKLLASSGATDIMFRDPFPREKDAIEHGQKQFGLTAKRKLIKQAA